MNATLEKIKKLYKASDYAKIEKAYLFAEAAHKEQRRISGELYITHPLTVCETLADLGMDRDTLIAALLHDVIEDTGCTEEELKQEFGSHVLEMVNAVTKLTRISFNSQEEEQAENMRRLLLAISKDVRVLMIKLADRLHNMRTMEHLPPEKRLKKSKETLDIYAPLAARLGMSNIKCELEDLAMKYIYPEDFEFIKNTINAKTGERMELVNRVAGIIEERMRISNIKGEVKGRPKHFYSIYKKMKNQGKTIDQIYDLIAVRVIVENKVDCYAILGDIHSVWKPIPGRFKDYIAVPKPNMYQSLHTTVVTDFGEIFEIQIRTYEMNKIAEYGIAAHWKYKEGRSDSSATDIDSKLGFIKQFMDVQGDLKDSHEFIDALKLNVAQNEIFVFSPKGDVFDLPIGANCIDFAYRLHSAVGNKCIGAKINSKIVPLNTELNNGDVVEVMTSNNSKGPSRDWLKIVKTPTARAKIRSFFKKEMKTENIKTGKDMMEKEAKHRGYSLSDLLQPNWVKYVMDRYSFSEIDDMYASVGYGGITTNKVLFKLIEFYKKDQQQKNQENLLNEGTIKSTAQYQKRPHSGIIVEGYDDFLIRLSRCCNPVPGDKIIGYISRGRGVSIHRADCSNMKNIPDERFLSAVWAKNTDDNSKFKVSLRIHCVDRYGMIGTISATIGGMKYSILQMNASVNDKKQTAVINIVIEIKDLAELDFLIKKLQGIEGVYEVDRHQ